MVRHECCAEAQQSHHADVHLEIDTVVQDSQGAVTHLAVVQLEKLAAARCCPGHAAACHLVRDGPHSARYATLPILTE